MGLVPVSWQGGTHWYLRLKNTPGPGPEPNQCIIGIILTTGQLPQINAAAIRRAAHSSIALMFSNACKLNNGVIDVVNDKL